MVSLHVRCHRTACSEILTLCTSIFHKEIGRDIRFLSTLNKTSTINIDGTRLISFTFRGIDRILTVHQIIGMHIGRTGIGSTVDLVDGNIGEKSTLIGTRYVMSSFFGRTVEFIIRFR